MRAIHYASVDRYSLHFFLYKPFAGGIIEAWEVIKKIVGLDLKIFMPSHVNDYKVSFFYLRFRILKIFRCNNIPLPLVSHIPLLCLCVLAAEALSCTLHPI